MRKPRLLFRLPGSFLLRFADRQFAGSLFQLPPRFTRLEPEAVGDSLAVSTGSPSDVHRVRGQGPAQPMGIAVSRPGEQCSGFALGGFLIQITGSNRCFDRFQ